MNQQETLIQRPAMILQLLLQLNRQHDTTLVIVTHDETIAGACSRILRMADGVVLQEEE